MVLFCRALFEVLKCGRKTDKIDKKAFEATFVVVLGALGVIPHTVKWRR